MRFSFSLALSALPCIQGTTFVTGQKVSVPIGNGSCTLTFYGKAFGSEDMSWLAERYQQAHVIPCIDPQHGDKVAAASPPEEVLGMGIVLGPHRVEVIGPFVLLTCRGRYLEDENHDKQLAIGQFAGELQAKGLSHGLVFVAKHNDGQ